MTLRHSPSAAAKAESKQCAVDDRCVSAQRGPDLARTKFRGCPRFRRRECVTPDTMVRGLDTPNPSNAPNSSYMANRPGNASNEQRGAISGAAGSRVGNGDRGTHVAAPGLTRRTQRPLSRRRHENPMRPTQQEFASPREWLIRLARESDGYRRLVRESGGTGRAAYRLARARCSSTFGSEPCLEDLQAAAELLATRLGSGGALPIQSLLPSAKSSAPPPTPTPERRAAEKSRLRDSRASI